tara:strand:- start:961 stop:1308 length:348 start_codon:yes stop_codon:yes gene_type:complete
MKRNIIIIFIAWLIVSCSNKPSTAIVEDYILGWPYEIVYVDGEPPYRKEPGLIVMYVPVVLLKPGVHTFGVRLYNTNSDRESENVVEIIHTVKAGEKYVIKEIGGMPTIVRKNEI